MRVIRLGPDDIEPELVDFLIRNKFEVKYVDTDEEKHRKGEYHVHKIKMAKNSTLLCHVVIHYSYGQGPDEHTDVYTFSRIDELSAVFKHLEWLFRLRVPMPAFRFVPPTV